MPRLLSSRAQAMLDLLPPYMADDNSVIASVTAAANEVDRIERVGIDFQTLLFPANADDTYRTLGMWETLLGLPVEPPGVDVQTRRNQVVSRLRSRSVAAGKEWVARIGEALAAGWGHKELVDPPYTIQIEVPYQGGGFLSARIRDFVRQITPAHLDLVFVDGLGFIVGVSDVGVDVL